MGSCLLFLFLGLDLKNGAAVIIAALGTNLVRGVRHTISGAERTIRVFRRVKRYHHIMSAALTRAGIRMTSFWIRHKFPL